MMDTMKYMEKASMDTLEHARANIRKWGLQDLKTLIVVATEELGETAKEVLDYGYTSRTRHRLRDIKREAKDFAAVGLQIMALVEKLEGDLESEEK